MPESVHASQETSSSFRNWGSIFCKTVPVSIARPIYCAQNKKKLAIYSLVCPLRAPASWKCSLAPILPSDLKDKQAVKPRESEAKKYVPGPAFRVLRKMRRQTSQNLGLCRSKEASHKSPQATSYHCWSPCLFHCWDSARTRLHWQILESDSSIPEYLFWPLLVMAYSKALLD